MEMTLHYPEFWKLSTCINSDGYQDFYEGLGMRLRYPSSIQVDGTYFTPRRLALKHNTTTLSECRVVNQEEGL